MSTLYICQVVQAFGSAGPSGLVLHDVGDEVVRMREPVNSAHLKLLRTEPASVMVVNPACAEAPQPAAIPAKQKRSAAA